MSIFCFFSANYYLGQSNNDSVISIRERKRIVLFDELTIEQFNKLSVKTILEDVMNNKYICISTYGGDTLKWDSTGITTCFWDIQMNAQWNDENGDLPCFSFREYFKPDGIVLFTKDTIYSNLKITSNTHSFSFVILQEGAKKKIEYTTFDFRVLLE